MQELREAWFALQFGGAMVAVLVNPNSQNAPPQMRSAEAAAHKLGVELSPVLGWITPALACGHSLNGTDIIQQCPVLAELGSHLDAKQGSVASAPG